MDRNGLLLCAKYSVAPNYFGYCGPDKNLNLVDHLKENIADCEVASILKEFETLYPYLQLIARDNQIPEPFSGKVVEAYWIGNSLLRNIKNIDYTDFLKEKFLLKNRLSEKNYFQIKSKVLVNYFMPHHSFHVFNIFKRTGHDASPHTLRTMDECRIGWGKIIQKPLCRDMPWHVSTNPLILVKNKLRIGAPILKEIKINYKGKSFLKNIKPGDFVSFHWSFACDILSLAQVKNLEYYTQQSINFFNHSLTDSVEERSGKTESVNIL